MARHTSTNSGTTHGRPLSFVLGGGCRSTPVTKEELFDYVRSNGWPSDAQVTDASSAESRAPHGEPIDLTACAALDIFGLGRAARNVQRGDDKARFEQVERGFFVWIEQLGRKLADRGDVLLLVQGPSTADPARQCRKLCVLSGITYNPKVFEVCHMKFQEGCPHDEVELALPVKAVLACRPCRVRASTEAFAISTSDEFIAELFRDMTTLTLYKPSYRCILQEGTNKWVEIDSLEQVGVLWSPAGRGLLGMQRLPRQRTGDAERLLQSLRSDNPFADNLQAKGARGRRGGGGGRRPRGGRANAGAHRASSDHWLAGSVLEPEPCTDARFVFVRPPLPCPGSPSDGAFGASSPGVVLGP